MSFLKKINFLRSRNDRLLSDYYKTLNAINALESSYLSLSDEELKAKFAELKARTEPLGKAFKKGELQQDPSKDKDIIAHCFAITREASKRVLAMRHFDVQIIGGLVLNDGRIAEMKTGEGKTLVATLPAVLNAICAKSVHIVTANDYLVKRDKIWMSKLYEFLGLSVGFVNSETDLEERDLIYISDVIYATNNEIGFDYLRDNMKQHETSLIRRGFDFAIVDEVDSILIDEARTPLIISGPVDVSTDFYRISDKIVKELSDDCFEIDEKGKRIHLTEKGYDDVEAGLKKYGLTNASEFVYGGVANHDLNYDTNPEFLHKASKITNCIEQCLKANKIFKDNVDYIVRDGKVMIVDEFTGRIMDGRRYSEGLHQALEAKHSCPIQQESQTLASVSFQNLFRLYSKLAGMTGTAKTEEDEFISIYGLSVVSIPTNKKVQRVDSDDLVFASEDEKFNAIAKKVQELYQKGQPVLVGTVSIAKSEKLSKLFDTLGIKHVVLNAKYHEKEADIISQAGRLKAVTIATNMAGRGTDIVLGGSIEAKLHDLKQKGKNDEVVKLEQEHAEECAKVKELGGLFIIGSERHESRRIDDQLRGRAGRQGDVGYSQFYLCLEDDLLRIFGGEFIKGLLTKLGLKKDEVINHPMLNVVIKKAQAKVENHNFEIRKNLLKYDDITNEQRNIFYSLRSAFLRDTTQCLASVQSYANDYLATLGKQAKEAAGQGLSYEHYIKDFASFVPVMHLFSQSEIEKFKTLSADDFFAITEQKINSAFEDFAKICGDIEAFRNFEQKSKDALFAGYQIKLEGTEEQKTKLHMVFELFNGLNFIVLHHLDAGWKEHLHATDSLRSGINLRSYAQKDPLNEYKMESFMMFEVMFERFKRQSILSCIAYIKDSVDEINKVKNL